MKKREKFFILSAIVFFIVCHVHISTTFATESMDAKRESDTIIATGNMGSNNMGPTWLLFDNGVVEVDRGDIINQGNGTSPLYEYRDVITKIVFTNPSQNRFIGGNDNLFRDLHRVESIEGLEYINTEFVDSFGYMFAGMTSLTSFDISTWNTSRASIMSGMFYEASSITSLDLSHFDTSRVTNMSYMFSGMDSLTSLNTSSWDTARLTNMTAMFFNTNRITSLDLSHFDTSNVTNMLALFRGMTSLTSLDISTWDTTKVTNMQQMFYDLRSIPSLNLLSFKTDKVTDMSHMFRGTHRLTSLDLSNFDTSNVTNMTTMFFDTPLLSTLNVSSFDTSKVVNMSHMFRGASSLSSLDLSSFNTNNVTSMAMMFASLDVDNVESRLTSLDLSHFNTSNVTDMTAMFAGAHNLKAVDLSSFDTRNVNSMSRMFAYANALETLDISNFYMHNVEHMEDMLLDTISLKELTLGTDKILSSDINLPEIQQPGYEGYWINIGNGSREEPEGTYVLTSEELVSTYDGDYMADTYIWLRRAPQYEITANDFTIHLKEVNDTLDIIALSNASALNRNDVDEVVTPIVRRSNIEKAVGEYEVVIGIDKDTTITKTIVVRIVDDKPINDYKITPTTPQATPKGEKNPRSSIHTGDINNLILYVALATISILPIYIIKKKQIIRKTK